MKIQIDTEKISQIATFTLSGELDFNELVAFIEAYHKKSDIMNKCLWDFSSVTGGARISVMHMGQFYGLCQKNFCGKSAHRIAFVVNEEMGFGFRQLMVMFEELYDVYLNVRVFKNMQDAKDWLLESS